MTASSGSEDYNPDESYWYDFSGLLMLGMPYLLLGSVGFMIYRTKTAPLAHGNGTSLNENGTTVSEMTPGVM